MEIYYFVKKTILDINGIFHAKAILQEVQDVANGLMQEEMNEISKETNLWNIIPRIDNLCKYLNKGDFDVDIINTIRIYLNKKDTERTKEKKIMSSFDMRYFLRESGNIPNNIKTSIIESCEETLNLYIEFSQSAALSRVKKEAFIIKQKMSKEKVYDIDITYPNFTGIENFITMWNKIQEYSYRLKSMNDYGLTNLELDIYNNHQRHTEIKNLISSCVENMCSAFEKYKNDTQENRHTYEAQVNVMDDMFARTNIIDINDIDKWKMLMRRFKFPMYN